MNLLKKFYQSIKELSQNTRNQQDLISCSEFLLDKLKKKDTETAFKNDIIEFLKYFFTASSTVKLFNNNHELFTKTKDCILEQNKTHGIKLMKYFNGFVVSNLTRQNENDDSGFTGDSARQVIKIYFAETFLDRVSKFVKSLRDVKVFQQQYGHSSPKQGSQKQEPFKDSIIIFDEIFLNLINLLEAIAKNSEKKIRKQKEVFDYIEKLCAQYLKMMNVVDFKAISEGFSKTNFKDFLQFVLRALSFFGNILVRKKDKYFEKQHFILQLSMKIEQESNRNQNKNLFVDVVVKLMRQIPINIPKFKEECFQNVKTFFCLYPSKMVDYIQILATDSFFYNESKIYYDFDVIRSIYFSWISTIKALIRNGPRIINNKSNNLLYHVLFENLFSVLFDDNIYFNYVLKVINYMSSLLELIQKNDQLQRNENVQKNPQFQIFLSNLMSKLVKYVKKTRKDIFLIIECLKKIQKSEDKDIIIDNLAKMSKDEIIRAFKEKGEKILKQEMINKEDLNSRYDQGNLVLNTVIVDYEKGGKLSDFIDEAIYKRLSFLNDLLLKAFQFYVKWKNQYTGKNSSQMQQEEELKCNSHFEILLEYPEEELLRKIFKENILIMNLLITNVKLIEEKYSHSSIKDIQFKLFEFVYWKKQKLSQGAQGTYEYYSIFYKQIHRIITKNIDDLILTFKNAEEQHGQQHRDYFQIILESLGCQFYHVFPPNESREDSIIERSRYLNKAFFKVIIRRIMELMQSDHIPFYHKLYQENPHQQYLLTILKGIYRTIKYKIRVHEDQFKQSHSHMNQKFLLDKKNMYIMDVKRETIDLIFVLIQQIFEKKGVYNYLYILKIILNVAIKNSAFENQFNEFCLQHDFKIIEFFKFIFCSKYDEMKSIALDILMDFQFDLKFLQLDKVEDVSTIEWFFEMLIHSLDQKENILTMKAWNALNQQMFKYYNKKQIQQIMNSKFIKLFTESLKINRTPDTQFSFLLQKYQIADYVFKARYVIRLISNYSEMINETKHFIQLSNQKKSQQQMEFAFLDENNIQVFENLNIGAFLDEIEQQLVSLKKKPFYYNLNFNSKTYNYLYQNKLPISISLDKLFRFLYVLVTQILNNQTEVPDQFLWKIMTCLYLLCFYLRVFKISELTEPTTDELIKLKQIFEQLQINQQRKYLLMRFLIQNCFTYLQLSIEKTLNPLQDLSKQIIIDILKENEQDFARSFVELIIEQMNSNDYHVLEAIFDILYNEIIPNLQDFKHIPTVLFNQRVVILLTLVKICNILDFRMKLELHEKVLDTFRQLSYFFFKEEETQENKQLLVFFQDIDRFQKKEILDVAIEIIKKMKKSNLQIKHVNLKQHIFNQTTMNQRLMKYKNESKEKFWNADFINEQMRLITMIRYSFRYQLIDINELKLEEINQIFEWINQICSENNEYCKYVRKERTFLLVKINKTKDEDLVPNNKLYYYNFDLDISVDKYDYIIKLFSNLIKDLIGFCFDFFENHARKIEKEVLTEKEQKEDLFKIQNQTSIILTKFYFRLENTITTAVFNQIRILVKYIGKHDDNKLIKKIFIPLKLLGGDESKQDTQISKQINEPILNIYFYQLQNFQNHLEMNKVLEIMQNFSKKLQEDIKNKIEIAELTLEDFLVIKKFYYILNWIRIQNEQRQNIFDQLKEVLRIEILLQDSQFVYSLYDILLQMINKQSNSLFYNYIFETIQNLYQNQESSLKSFFLIYDIFKHEKSICMRERISREQIIDSIIKESSKTNEKTYWLSLLYPISKNSNYFFESKNFNAFSTEMFRIIDDNKAQNDKYLVKDFFSQNSLFLKIMKNYLRINPFSQQMDIYIKQFLKQQNFNLREDVLCYIRPFEDKRSEEKFVQKVKRCILNDTTDQLQQKADIFYLTEIAPRYLQFLSQEGIQTLLDCDEYEKLFLKLKNSSVSNSLVVANIKFVSLLYLKSESNKTKNLMQVFPYTWNNIAFPQEGEDRIKNVCILMVSTFMKKNPQEIKEKFQSPKLKPLFETVLIATKIFDHDSKLLWLKSLHQILELYKQESKDWFRDVLGAYDFNELVYSSKRWIFAIDAKDLFEEKFFDLFKQKFFQDNFLQLNDLYDCLLIVANHIINNMDKEGVENYLDEGIQNQIIQKLINSYTKDIQESHTHEHQDKIFNLLLIYLKLFDKVNYSFDIIHRKFLDTKSIKKSQEDVKSQKFSKLIIQNLTLIFYFLKKNQNHPQFPQYSQLVLQYIPSQHAYTNPLTYIKYTKIPILIFNIMKICFKDPKNLEVFQGNVETILKNYSRENKDMMIGVFFFHFALKNLDRFKKYKVINIEHILDHVLGLVTNDKKNYSNFVSQSQKHSAHGLFDLKDDLNIPEYSFIALYKFFTTTLIKTLFLCYKHTVTEQDFSYLKNLLKKIAQDLSFDNIQIKQMVLNLVRSLLLPESPHAGYEIYTSDAFTQQQKEAMLIEIKVTEKQLQKEYMNPHFKTYLNSHVGLVIKYLEQNQLSEQWNSFLVNDCIKAFSSLNSQNKDNLIKRLGKSVDYDYLQLFAYILENLEQDRYSYLIYHMEGDVTLCVFTEIFCRVLKLKSIDVSLSYNGQQIVQSQLIYERFLGVIEGKTYTANFLFQTLRGFLKHLYSKANDQEKERFIISMIHFLTGETTLIPFDQNQLIEILMDISENFQNSDLIFKVLQLKDVSHRFIQKYEKIENPTDKQMMFAQSLLGHTKSLFYNDNVYLNQQNSKMIKKFEKIEILSELKKYEKLKQLTQSLIKERENNNQEEIKDEMIDQFLQENWMQAKMNLGEWQDIHEVVQDTENYDIQIEALKNLGKIDEKFELLKRKAQPKNKSIGIVDLCSYIIEKIELFEDVNELKHHKQKDFLFLYNYLYQKANDIEANDENLIGILDNHQISYEFQQGYDLFLYKSSKNSSHETQRMQDMKQINYEWRQKIPSQNRELYVARKILDQRGFISEQFYKMIKRTFKSQGESQIIRNEKRILDNPFYNKLQILKLERLQNVPPSLDLSKMKWEQYQIKDLMIHVVYKLYKENYYAGVYENLEVIRKVIQQTYTSVLQLRFKVFDFKMAIRENRLLQAYNLASNIQDISKVEHFNGKFYEQLFNFLYKYITTSKIFPPKIMIDFYDAFGKSLSYDFDKNARKNFYKFLIVHRLQQQYQQQNQYQWNQQQNQMPTINESSQDKSEEQIIQQILAQFPLKVFKPFMLEIYESFILDKEKQQQIIFRTIISRLQSQDPIDLYYSTEKLKLLLKNKFFEQFENMFKKFLPQKAISFQNLTLILQKYIYKMKIQQHMLIHKIVENFYINKALDKTAIQELTQNEEDLKSKISEISLNQTLSNMQKVHQVITFLENWLQNNPPIKQTFIPEFLLYNQIYLVDNVTNNLKLSHDYKRKQYILQPYFYCRSSNGVTSIEIKMIDEKNKIKSLLIKPVNIQRRKQGNENIDYGMFLMYYKINEIMLEPFFQSNLTKNSYQKLPENFVVLNDDWYVVDKRKEVSLVEIEKQGYLNPNDQHLHFASSEENQESTIEQTLSIYPKDFFKKYLIQNFIKPEQIGLVANRVAQSIAYDYFSRYVFGFETKFNDQSFNRKTGLIYTDINSSFSNLNEQQLARLTPNIMYLMNQTIYRRKFLATILALKEQMLEEKNEIYLNYAAFVLQCKNNEKQNIKDKSNTDIQCEQQMKKLKDLKIETLCTQMEKMKDTKFLQKKYKLIDKPWF